MCGKASAPLAAELVRSGFAVSGSDAHLLPPVADFLVAHRLNCRKGFAAENISADLDLVLAGALCGEDNPELRRARELGLPVSNFARFLGSEYLVGSRNAVVAGSFGKTTTTAMLAMILREAGQDPGWLVGGQCPDLPCPVHLRRGGRWVLEGDEYPSGPDDPSPKFRHYHPELGIITSVAFVHQNKITSLAATVGLMADFVASVRGSSPVFAADDLVVRRCLQPACPRGRLQTVGFSPAADRRLTRRRPLRGRNAFTLDGVEFELAQRGKFACTNAALAALTAETLGVPLRESASTISRFRGVAGRQEILVDSPELTVVYDMGVYPRSIAKVVGAFREPGRRMCVLFQPRHTLGNSGVYHRDLVRAFAPVDLLLLADANNLPAAAGVFPFDAGRLGSSLPSGGVYRAVGPAQTCFAAWQGAVRPGDLWLVFTEPVQTEPLASIRAFIGREPASVGEC